MKLWPKPSGMMANIANCQKDKGDRARLPRSEDLQSAATELVRTCAHGAGSRRGVSAGDGDFGFEPAAGDVQEPIVTDPVPEILSGPEPAAAVGPAGPVETPRREPQIREVGRRVRSPGQRPEVQSRVLTVSSRPLNLIAGTEAAIAETVSNMLNQ